MERTSYIPRILFLVVLGVLWAIWYVALSPPSIVLWLLPVALVATVVMTVLGRRRMHRGNTAPSTGVILSPPRQAPRALPARWVGGGNLPGDLGRMNATWPLVAFDLAMGSLAISVRPRFLGGLFGAASFRADVAGVVEVVPVRSASTKGIGVVPAGGDPIVYFWSMGADRSEILHLAAVAGFPVSWEERKARTW